MTFPRWLVAISIVANTLTCGPAHMSLCARMYHNEKKGSWVNRLLRKMTDKLFFFDPGHCQKAHILWRRGQKKRDLNARRSL